MSGRIATAALALIAAGTAVPAQACNQHLLVSGYFSNNVAIYDACNGQFLRQLDQASRIIGAQAVRLNPVDDLIYVVSEGNDQIQRYRHDDYGFVDVFAQLADDVDPDGLAFGLDGRVYVASYGTSSVLELDRHSGQVIGTVLPAGSGLLGADNGMMVSAAGLLYVPGYDSDSVARVNPATGEVQGTFIAAGAGGLAHTRGIVDEGETILVGGERSGAVYRFNANTGALVGTLASGFSRPTGMTRAANGELLVLAGNRVRRIDRTSGVELGILANGTDGGISGGTFIALVSAQETGSVNMPIGNGFTGTWVEAAAAGQIGLGLEVLPGGNLVAEMYTYAPAGGQAWVGGVGPIIDGDHATITVSTINGPGGRFAPNFDPSQVANTTWGTLSLRFSDCNHGTLDWASSVPGYGSGSLPIIRMTLPAGLSCP